MPFDQPCGVVGLAEREQREAEFLDGFECSQLQQVIFERSDEAFSEDVAFGRAHEGGRAFDAEKAQLALERVGHVLRAVIVAHAQAM